MKLKLLLLFLIFPCFAFGQDKDTDLSIGNISVSISPRTMKDGSISDISLGFIYHDFLCANIRYRQTTISANEEFVIEGVEDSLNAMNQNIYEIFLLPVSYWKKGEVTRFQAGIGAYYKNDSLKERGFFNMPVLSQINMAPVNSYKNESVMHIVGPLVDARAEYKTDFARIKIFGGVVPVFNLNAEQKISMVPLVGTEPEKYKQSVWGTPYVYLNAEIIIMKYIVVGAFFEYACMNYEILDFDYNLKWIRVENDVTTQRMGYEASFLLPLGNHFNFQIGYGHIFDTITANSNKVLETNKPYFIVSAGAFL